MAFLFVEIADMLLPAYLTLLESSIGNVSSFLLLVHFKVVFHHLLLNREPVLQDHCILDRSQLLLDLDSVETHWVVFAARRQSHLLGTVSQQQSSSLLLLLPVVVLELKIGRVVQV